MIYKFYYINIIQKMGHAKFEIYQIQILFGFYKNGKTLPPLRTLMKASNKNVTKPTSRPVLKTMHNFKNSKKLPL